MKILELRLKEPPIYKVKFEKNEANIKLEFKIEALNPKPVKIFYQIRETDFIDFVDADSLKLDMDNIDIEENITTINKHLKFIKSKQGNPVSRFFINIITSFIDKSQSDKDSILVTIENYEETFNT